jgi:hypothetical protein
LLAMSTWDIRRTLPDVSHSTRRIYTWSDTV